MVNPAEKQEEDDEDDDEEDDDENDEDDADEVSVEAACPRGRRGSPPSPPIDQAPPRRRSRLAFFPPPSGPRASSGPTSDAFKLLASCVSCATAIVCVVALAAPVTDSPTGGGGGAFRHMSGATERRGRFPGTGFSCNASRSGAARKSRRTRRELTRRRFGCGASLGAQPAGRVVRCPPGRAGTIFWGAEGPIPRGAHRVSELWSEPKSRLASAADAACSLLARASRVCSGGGRARRRRAGRPGVGFERATRDLLAAKAGALASAAALLAEPEAANAAGSKRVPALVDALVRCGVGGAGRGAAAASRVRGGWAVGWSGWAGFLPARGGCLVGTVWNCSERFGTVRRVRGCVPAVRGRSRRRETVLTGSR